MGMAASQARFLNLTARKTNIEYEGQQINQQRTELSNESANLYNQMLTLQVPTPPNTQDYTKVTYTFMMPGGNDEATISQISPTSTDGKYTITFSYKTVELGMAACTDNQKPTARNSGTAAAPSYNITTTSGKQYDLIKYDGSQTGTDKQKEAYKLHNDAVVALKNGQTMDIYYVNVGTEAVPKYQYYKSTELATATAAAAQSNAVTYYTASDITSYKEDSYTPCTVNRDVQNRVQSFTHTSSNTTFAVTTNTITDEDAYNDAMNEYTYKSYLYEQEMNNINARTSIIQAQDKELELKLKQLDTEHNAVQTEMDTVKDLCKKNVEDSFKTFA